MLSLHPRRTNLLGQKYGGVTALVGSRIVDISYDDATRQIGSHHGLEQRRAYSLLRMVIQHGYVPYIRGLLKLCLPEDNFRIAYWMLHVSQMASMLFSSWSKNPIILLRSKSVNISRPKHWLVQVVTTASQFMTFSTSRTTRKLLSSLCHCSWNICILHLIPLERRWSVFVSSLK